MHLFFMGQLMYLNGSAIFIYWNQFFLYVYMLFLSLYIESVHKHHQLAEQQSSCIGLLLTKAVLEKISPIFPVLYTIDGHWGRHLSVDPTPELDDSGLKKLLDPHSSSSSIVHMSVPQRLMAAEAKVMETKGGLGINSELTSSFWILSHAKHQACVGQKGTLTITASHWATVGDSHFRLIDKWKGLK